MRFRSFARNEGGAAAIEFALVAPILALALVIIADGASLLLHYFDMRTAISSAAQYVMVGGSSDTTARSIALSAWTTRAHGADVTVSSQCKCGNTVSVCNALCTDESVPKSYKIVQATSTFTGSMISQSMSASETVRVR